MTRRKLVVANWKMNGSLAANAAWVREFAAAGELPCETAVCAPFVYLPSMVQALAGTATAAGAQDVSEYEAGAYTGEVSAPMLSDVGAKWVIVGHSERRSMFGDTDSRVAAKVKAALAAGLKPIVCVGETLEERKSDQTLRVVETQLSAVLAEAGAGFLTECAVAYEPVWAIGTGRSATPEEAQAVHAAIRSLIARFDAKAALCTRILYGGSVKPGNAAELFAQDDIDGGLIGGAALKSVDFLAICRA